MFGRHRQKIYAAIILITACLGPLAHAGPVTVNVQARFGGSVGTALGGITGGTLAFGRSVFGFADADFDLVPNVGDIINGAQSNCGTSIAHVASCIILNPDGDSALSAAQNLFPNTLSLIHI